MKSGVVVAMASHNSARFMARTLASIDQALAGRPYALVIADDASTDATLRIARQTSMAAQERIIVGLPKAPGIAESKNRAIKIARTLTDHRFPWVAPMDDDDEMVGPRFSMMLERMEAEGQKFAVGDWMHFLEGRRTWIAPGDWSAATMNFSPCCTLVHRDLIPRGGDYFVPVPRDVHEDVVTHTRVMLGGAPLCCHTGEPVHVYHQRADSHTLGPEHSAQMRRNTDVFMAGDPPTRTTIRSFCTVAFGPALPEAELMLRSLRIMGNHQPVVVLTNEQGAVEIQSWGVPDVEVHLADTAAFEARFAEAAHVYSHTSLNLGAFLGKMDVLEEAVRRHGSSMYLDADMVVLRRFLDVIDAPLALAPELNRSCHDGRPSRWEGNERFGYFSGGCVYLNRDGLHLADHWRRDYLKTWQRFGRDDGPHGCFTDQSSLELLPLLSDVHVLHPGHNLMYTRVPKDAPHFSHSLKTREDVLARTKILARHGLFFRGWPVVTMHAHFRTPNWATDASRAFRRVLGFSELAEHREILSLVEAPQVSS